MIHIGRAGEARDLLFRAPCIWSSTRPIRQQRRQRDEEISALPVGLRCWSCHPAGHRADDFEFHAPPSASDAATPAAMRDLAERVLPVYEEPDEQVYLSNLSALQLVAGSYAAATPQSLRERGVNAVAGQRPDRALPFDLYAQARRLKPTAARRCCRVPRRPSASRFPAPRRSRCLYGHVLARGTSLPSLQESRSWPSTSAFEISLAGSGLIWTYLAFDVYRQHRSAAGYAPAKTTAATISEDKLRIRTAAGVDVCTQVVVRPKGDSKARLPALLQFTLPLPRRTRPKCSAAHRLRRRSSLPVARMAEPQPDRTVRTRRRRRARGDRLDHQAALERWPTSVCSATATALSPPGRPAKLPHAQGHRDLGRDGARRRLSHRGPGVSPQCRVSMGGEHTQVRCTAGSGLAKDGGSAVAGAGSCLVLTAGATSILTSCRRWRSQAEQHLPPLAQSSKLTIATGSR